ncbi:hypothetical protein ACTMTJ_04140 [Phytohabitans sp. LJ34]|uniref:hypothetical protein n=1 Tax=Phytohabitans sp. LJ34 TaxID=3452217 RepID=UPI003F8945C8
MTRINRPDTLLTELRDLKRRLRLLEAARMRATPAAAAALAAAGAESAAPAASAGAESAAPAAAGAESTEGRAAGVPLMPARPSDWPGTSRSSWERLAVTWTTRGGRLVVRTAADPDTAGEARVLVDGEPVGEVAPVSPDPARSTVDIPPPAGGEVEVAVEARRTSGPGLVRVAAALQPS